MSYDIPLHFASQRDADAHILREEVRELERKKRMTTKQKARLALLQKQLTALQSPVHKLPDDLLMYIFELASHSGDDMDAGSTLSRVGSRWRRVAICTPCLWIHITITRPHRNGRSGDRLATLLQRSGAKSVVLTVDLSAHYNISVASATLHSAAVLTQRAKVLHLEGNRGAPWDLPFSFPVSSALLELSISGIMLDTFDDWIEFTTSCLSSCSALEKLTLEDLACCLGAIGASEGNLEPVEISLPNLETVTLGGRFDMLPLRLFSHIRALPKAITLPTVNYPGDEDDVLLVLSHFNHQFKNLQSLTLAGSGYTTCGIKAILSYTEHLQELVVKAATLLECQCDTPRTSLSRIELEGCHAADGLRGIIHAMDEKHAKKSLTIRIAWCMRQDVPHDIKGKRDILLMWFDSMADQVIEDKSCSPC